MSADGPQVLDREYQPSNLALIHDPHGFYSRAREAAPIFKSSRFGYWVVTRYADVMEILRNKEGFGKRVIQPATDFTPEAAEIMKGYRRVPIFDTNGEQHARYRSFVKPAFSPTRLQAREPILRDVGHSLVDAFIGDGSGDLVTAYAYRLPAVHTFDMLGIPPADLEDVWRWSISHVRVVFNPAPPEEQVQLARETVALYDYCYALVEDRRQHLGEDLISDLLRPSETGDEPLTTDEVVSMLITLVVAGHRTSTSLIGNTTKHLLLERSRWERVVAEPSLAASAVEETLRYDGSTNGIWYQAFDDVEVAGTKIKAGEVVYLVFTSANHDDSAFEDPDVWDMDRRSRGKHLSFGWGTHICAGLALGRMTGKVAIEVLVDRLPKMRLVEQELVYQPMMTARALDQLLVAWD